MQVAFCGGTFSIFSHTQSFLKRVKEFSFHCNFLFKDSFLVSGVAFKKTFSYAGFEMQPKIYKNCKIALLNIELELKAERDNAEVRVDSVEVSL